MRLAYTGARGAADQLHRANLSTAAASSFVAPLDKASSGVPLKSGRTLATSHIADAVTLSSHPPRAPL